MREGNQDVFFNEERKERRKENDKIKEDKEGIEQRKDKWRKEH